MKAVIMAGGQGSRLKPLTERTPKPMVHALNKPLAEHMINYLKRYGFKEFIFTLHFRPLDIQRYFMDGAELNCDIKYSIEDEPLGTAGSVKLAEKMIKGPFIVVSGDAIVDFDLGKALRFHKAKNSIATLVLTRVKNPVEYGIVVTDKEGRVVRFQEKPAPHEVFTDTVNTGIYILNREVLDDIPTRQPFDFSHDLFPLLLENKKPVFGYVADGYWCDVGDIASLHKAQNDILNGLVQFPMQGKKIKEGLWVGEKSNISPLAHVHPPVYIGNYVQIKEGATVGPYTVLGNYSVIDRHANVTRSVIQANSYVGENAHVNGAIMGKRVIVTRKASIADGSVVGDNTLIGNGAEIRAGVKIWPDKRIERNAVVNENIVWGTSVTESLFTATGVEGLANVAMRPDFAAQLGEAFGAYLGIGKRIITARDASPYSRIIKDALVTGLNSVGVDVFDLKYSSIPFLQYGIALERQFDAGVYVGMSDEHPSVVSISFFDDNGTLISRNAQRKMEMTLMRGDFPLVPLDLIGQNQFPPRIYEPYMQEALQSIDVSAKSGKKPRVLLVADTGSATNTFVDMLIKLGVEVIHEYLPSVREPYQFGRGREVYDILSGLTRRNASLGIWLHPANTRAILADESGQVIDQELTRLIFYMIYIRAASVGARIFVPPWLPRIFGKWIRERKLKAVPLSKLDAAVNQLAVREKESLRVWPEFTHYYVDRSVLFALIKLVEHLIVHKTDLSALAAEIPPRFIFNASIRCPAEKMGAVMRSLGSLFGDAYREQQDGVKVWLKDGWLLIRTSGDGQLLDLTVEGKDAGSAEEMLALYGRKLKNLVERSV